MNQRFYLSARSVGILSDAEESLRTVMQEAIKSSPYDFGISWAYRTPAKQKELFRKGRDEDGNIIDKSKVVTYVDGVTKFSKHNCLPSQAVDIVCYVNGEVTWEHSVYLEVGLHIMEVAEELFEDGKIKDRIIWGGFWKKFKDWPHFQI